MVVGCESTMERLERRKLLYANAVFVFHFRVYCAVCKLINLLTMHVAGQWLMHVLMTERIEVMADFNAFLLEGLLLLLSKNYFHLDERCRSNWTLVHILWRMTFDDTAFHCPKRSLIELGKRGFILSVHLLSKQNRESFNMATDVL